MRHRTRFLLAILMVFALTAAGCGDGGTAGDGGGGEAKGPVTIGSKIDTEGSILGSMVLLALEDAGFTVEDRLKTGPTDVVRKALLEGEIDMYPEYTGTALGVFFSNEVTDTAVLKDAAASYELARQLDAENNDIVWLDKANANNTFAIAIPRKLSDDAGLKTLADFARYVNDGGEVKLVASQEFVDRPDGLPSFETGYGFELDRADQVVILAGGDTAATEKAAAEGTDGANAAMAYGTDGSLAALDLVVLADPEGVQPVYEPAMTVRKEVMDRYPEIATIVNPIFAKLDLTTLQELNGRVAAEGEDPKAVAEDFLKTNGFID
jgi:osmoprotectant transport system substrate-binding protein